MAKLAYRFAIFYSTNINNANIKHANLSPHNKFTIWLDSGVDYIEREIARIPHAHCTVHTIIA